MAPDEQSDGRWIGITPGTGTAVVGRHVAVLLAAGPEHPLVADLWAEVGEGDAGFDASLAVLGAAGFDRLPDLAMAGWEGGAPRVVVRGDVVVAVGSEDGRDAVEITGAEVHSWAEHTVPRDGTVHMRLGPLPRAAAGSGAFVVDRGRLPAVALAVPTRPGSHEVDDAGEEDLDDDGEAIYATVLLGGLPERPGAERDGPPAEELVAPEEQEDDQHQQEVPPTSAPLDAPPEADRDAPPEPPVEETVAARPPVAPAERRPLPPPAAATDAPRGRPDPRPGRGSKAPAGSDAGSGAQGVLAPDGAPADPADAPRSQPWGLRRRGAAASADPTDTPAPGPDPSGSPGTLIPPRPVRAEAVDPEPPSLLQVPVAGASEGDEDGHNPYDHLFGSTELRSVEDAAMRADDDGGPAAPPPSANAGDGTSVIPGGVDADHDGRTIGVEQLRRALGTRGEGAGPVPAGSSTTDGHFLAVRCPRDHLNPVHGHRCRVCERPLSPDDPELVAKLDLGVFRFSTGAVVEVTRPMLIGRAPRLAGEVRGEMPDLVPVPSPDQDISRTHLEVRLEGWQVLLLDKGSTNGTSVTLPGREAHRLRPDQPYPLPVGAVVSLADEVEFSFEAER